MGKYLKIGFIGLITIEIQCYLAAILKTFKTISDGFSQCQN